MKRRLGKIILSRNFFFDNTLEDQIRMLEGLVVWNMDTNLAEDTVTYWVESPYLPEIEDGIFPIPEYNIIFHGDCREFRPVGG